MRYQNRYCILVSTDFESWCVISTDRKCFILVSMGNNIYQLNLGGAAQLIVNTFPILKSWSIFIKIL